MDQIPEDPSATRFERKIDLLPFRAEQLAPTEKATLEALLDLRDCAVLSWEFVAADSIDVRFDRWPLDAKAAAEHQAHFMGRKTGEAFRLAMGFVVAQRECCVDWEDVDQDGTTCRIGPYEVRTGRPSLDVSDLDEPHVHALLIVPHRTRRGPNGVWTIGRGPAHAVTRLFDGVAAWYHRRGECPDMVHWSILYSLTARVLQLFASKEEAAEAQRQQFDDDGELECFHAAGPLLLRAIAGADAVDLYGHDMLPLTRKGVLWVKEVREEGNEVEVVSAAALVEQLRKRLTAASTPPRDSL